MKRCDEDCFNCPYEDCILGDDDAPEGDACADAQVQKLLERERSSNEPGKRQRKYYPERTRVYYQAHREEYLKYMAEYYARNKEEISVRKKEYRIKRRVKADALGLCRDCVLFPRLEGYKRCGACLAKAREKKRKYKERKRMKIEEGALKDG